jgi:hypothetical protein
LKSEIADQRPEIRRDAYAGNRASFPAGMPGRIASTMSRSAHDVPPVTAPRSSAPPQPTNTITDDASERAGFESEDVDSVEIQALHKVEFGKRDSNGNR